ncbi:hypothetical protein V8E36_001066 [Tilletia maclaganii]
MMPLGAGSSGAGAAHRSAPSAGAGLAGSSKLAGHDQAAASATGLDGHRSRRSTLRSSRPRLPHVPVHSAHTLTNVVCMSWTAALPDHASPHPGATYDFSTPGSLNPYTPAASASTPKLHQDMSPNHAAALSSASSTVTFSWRRYVVKPIPSEVTKGTPSSDPDNAGQSSAAALSSPAELRAQAWRLLSQCAADEARTPPSSEPPAPPGREQPSLASDPGAGAKPSYAGDYLFGRILFAFDDQGDSPAVSEKTTIPAPPVSRVASTSAATQTPRKRKRVPDVKGSTSSSTSPKAEATRAASQKENQAVAPSSSPSGYAIWLFEATPLSQLKQFRHRDPKGKGKARAVDETPFEWLSVTNGLESKLPRTDRQEIARLLSSHFDIQASGTLHPTSASVFAPLRLDNLSSPSLLQPMRRYRREHDLLSCAIRERLINDFVHARGWDGSPIAASIYEGTTKLDALISQADQPTTASTAVESSGLHNQHLNANSTGATGRPRSGTMDSSSEEGEIIELEEGEHIEDGEIEEEPRTDPGQAPDLGPEQAHRHRSRSRVRLPKRDRLAISRNTRPVRFGSMVIMLSDDLSRTGLHARMAETLLCIRFGVNAGPETMELSILPTYVRLTQLSNPHLECDQIDDLEQALLSNGFSTSAESSSDRGLTALKCHTPILMAPSGFADEEQERHWLWSCKTRPTMTGPRTGSQPHATKGLRHVFLGALSSRLNVLVTELQTQSPRLLSQRVRGRKIVNARKLSSSAAASTDGDADDSEEQESVAGAEEEQPGWWLPSKLRDDIAKSGVDLTMLGSRPQWAVVRCLDIEDRAQTDNSTDIAMLHKEAEEDKADLAGVPTNGEPKATPSESIEVDGEASGPIEDSGRSKSPFPEDVIIWPLSLCFLPTSFDQTCAAATRDASKSNSDVAASLLPFDDPRAAPIYLPPKVMTSMNVADVLDRASQCVRALHNPAQAVTSAATSAAEPLSTAGALAHSVTIEDDLMCGLPRHFSQTLQSAADSQSHSTKKPGSSTTVNLLEPSALPATNLPTAVPRHSINEEIWASVLGVTTAGSFSHENAIGQQMTPNNVVSNGGAAKLNGGGEMDAFDGMDLVTEDDFSFFDNVSGFDFGDMGVNNGLVNTSLPLPGPTGPYLEPLALVTDGGVSMGSYQTSSLVVPEVPQASLIMLPEHQGMIGHHTAALHGPISTDTGPSQTATDHPSMPGFTPSSLTASSPAFGLNGQPISKTPRTPFSPLEDIAEPSVSFHAGGGYPSLKQHLASLDSASNLDIPGLHMDRSRSELDHVRSDFKAKDQIIAMDLDNQNPLFLHSKYDSGKFAIPPTQPLTVSAASSPPKSGTVQAVVTQPRTPTHQKFRFITRRGLLRGSINATPNKRRTAETTAWVSGRNTVAQLRQLSRADEEFSEVGTLDNMSDTDISDVHSDESDEEMEEDVKKQETQKALKLLLHGSERLLDYGTGWGRLSSTEERADTTDQSHANLSSQSTEAATVEESEQMEQWRRAVLESIAMNPPLRAQALAEQGDSSHLPPVTAQDAAAVLERFSAALMGPEHDMSHLLLSNVVQERSDPETGSVELSSSRRALSGSTPDVGGTVDVLEPPQIMTGCQGFATRMAPTALKFWDKLGLNALGGPKSVAPFVLQLDASDFLLQSAVKWLERIDSIFQTYGLGSHTPNSHSILRLEDGSAINIAEVLGAMAIDDAQQERWEDTMRSILDTLRGYADDASHIIIYVVGTPGWPMRWQGLTRMREELTNMAQQRLGTQGWQLQLRGVPQMVIFESGAAPLGAGHRIAFDVKRFAFHIYDSLQRAVPHATGKVVSSMGRNYGGGLDLVQYHAFILAPLYQRHMMDIGLKWPLTSRNVVDRGSLLHIGYELRAADGCVIVVGLDQRGQSMFIDTWKAKVNLVENLLITWIKALQFARRSNVAWRFVICKTSCMALEEISAWSSLERCGMLRGPGILDVTLACVDTDTPLAMLPTADAPSGFASAPSSPGAVMLDSSHFNYAIYPTHRVAVSRPALSSHYTASQPHPAESPATQSRMHSARILALASSATVRIPRHTDLSMASIGTFSSQVFSLPTHRRTPHVMWLHILQVYSNDHPPPEAPRFGREANAGHPGHGHQSRLGGTAGLSAELGGLDPFLSTYSAPYGRLSSTVQSHVAGMGRHGSPMSAGTAQTLSAAGDFSSLSSSGAPAYGGSLSVSAATSAQAATAAASALARSALSTRLRDITQSMHELQLLSTERYSLAEPACFLPAHLALLAVTAPALSSYTYKRPSTRSSKDAL